MSEEFHYINRTANKEIKSLSEAYPITTILGPRQSGKTTLARHLFPHKPCYNLEAPDIRASIEDDPRGFLSHHAKGAILDEMQRYPDLLSYLQVHVDETKKEGKYVLTGSHQLLLSKGISQSLAGRTGLFHLYPLSIQEINQTGTAYGDLNRLLYQGGYPRLYQSSISPTKYYRDYVQTYLERDVRDLINIKDLRRFQTFLRLCAGRSGQILNFNSIATESGVSINTIKEWISVLEASFIIKILPPYHVNLGKRLVKSPKLYFTDTGLLCFLLGIKNPDHLIAHPLRGNIFETLIVSDILKENWNLGLDHSLYFFRDSNHQEVDMVFETSKGVILVEIKCSETFHKDYLKGIIHMEKTYPIHKGYVIYAGQEAPHMAHPLLSYKNYYQTLFQLN